jgi:hypothetical protein
LKSLEEWNVFVEPGREAGEIIEHETSPITDIRIKEPVRMYSIISLRRRELVHQIIEESSQIGRCGYFLTTPTEIRPWKQPAGIPFLLHLRSTSNPFVATHMVFDDIEGRYISDLIRVEKGTSRTSEFQIPILLLDSESFGRFMGDASSSVMGKDSSILAAVTKPRESNREAQLRWR